MAQSAIRNLNGFEFGGRTLRVDKASSQADELRLLHQQTTVVGAPTFETVQSANVLHLIEYQKLLHEQLVKFKE